jgi:hypothetical protein
MNVGDQRRVDPVTTELIPDLPEVFGIPLRRNGKPDDFAARLVKAPALLDGSGGIPGMGIGHRLDPDRLVPPQRYGSEGDLPGITTAIVIH